MRARSLAALCLALSAAPLAAQDWAPSPRLQPELRADLSVARHTAAVLMAGINVPLGIYLRAGAAVGLGATSIDGATQQASRADVTVRFLLDPFAESRWGPYVGGGLTARRDGHERARAGLLIVLGLEGKQGKQWNTAGELALGEGLRAAVILRRPRRTGR